MNIEEKISSILSLNTSKKAVEILAKIMRNIAKNDITIADNPDASINYEIDSVITKSKIVNVTSGTNPDDSIQITFKQD